MSNQNIVEFLESLGFRDLRELGCGSEGRVFTAYHDDYGWCVVKVPYLDRPISQALVRRYRRAAAVPARGNHVALARSLLAGEKDGIPYLVMEHVRGLPLDEVVSASGSLSVGCALRLMLQLCRAMSAVHQRGDTHGDLSPGNILVDQETGWVTVIDFGLSIRGDEEHAWGGTPGFVSPEAALGTRVDQRTDVFSIGSLLGYSLTGAELVPVSDDDSVNVARALSPSHFEHDEFPDGVVTIVNRARAHAPSQRYESAAAMAEAIEAALLELEPHANEFHGVNQTSSDDNTGPQSPDVDSFPPEAVSIPPVRRHRGLVAVVATLAVAAFLTGAGALERVSTSNPVEHSTAVGAPGSGDVGAPGSGTDATRPISSTPSGLADKRSMLPSAAASSKARQARASKGTSERELSPKDPARKGSASRDDLAGPSERSAMELVQQAVASCSPRKSSMEVRRVSLVLGKAGSIQLVDMAGGEDPVVGCVKGRVTGRTVRERVPALTLQVSFPRS